MDFATINLGNFSYSRKIRDADKRLELGNFKGDMVYIHKYVHKYICTMFKLQEKVLNITLLLDRGTNSPTLATLNTLDSTLC